VEDQTKLLGSLFVEENLLAPEQLERALRFSKNTGLPLDQIVVAEFPIPQPDISRLLGEVSRSADGGGATDADAVFAKDPAVSPIRSHVRRPIGQIFVDLGFITPDDREAALTVQREGGGLLGEILITQGKITRLELANALSAHWESATGADDTSRDRGPSLIDVPREDESRRRVEPSNAAAELRRSIAELESARIADAEAAEARITAIDEALAALTEARAAEAEATRIANDELRERLDELIALRTADLETSRAASSEAAQATAETGRIEQVLAGALAEFAVKVDDLARRLDEPAPEVSRKRSKRAKDEKKRKR